jgi:hypothetical protein
MRKKRRGAGLLGRLKGRVNCQKEPLGKPWHFDKQENLI